MTNIERLRRLAIGLYVLPFLGHLAYQLFDDRPGIATLTWFFAAIALPPAILYFLGVRWCRYAVGILSVLFLLVSFVVPMALHAVDRTGTFWFFWVIEVLVLVFSCAMSFATDRKGDHAASLRN